MLMTELNLSDLSLKEWPELYGFHIYGDGPTYVVHVEPNSISDKAGIRVGDMIIELDGCNVSKDSADDVRSIARIAKRKPPPICVQCVTQRVSINNFKYQKKHMNGCGFSVKGDSPVKVEDMDNKSKAHKAGMRSGDIIVDVNNSTVNKERDFKELLEQSDKNLDIGFLSIQNGSGQGQNELVRLSQWSKSSSKLSQNDMRVEDRTDSIKLPNTDHLLPMPKMSDLETEPKKNAKSSVELKVLDIRPSSLFSDEMDMHLNSPDFSRRKSSKSPSPYNEPWDKRKSYHQNSPKDESSYLQQTDKEGLDFFSDSFFDNQPKNRVDSIKSSIKSSSKVIQTQDKRPVKTSDKITQTLKDTKSSSSGRIEKKVLDKEAQNQIKPNSKLGNMSDGETRLKILKKAKEPIGVIFKKSFNKPVEIVSIDEDSPTQLCGVNPDGVILAVNDVSVGDDKGVTNIKKMLNQAEISHVVVTQKSEYDKEKTFRELVIEVLSAKERSKLKKILLRYNDSGNTGEYIELVNRLLNTSAKKVLWSYLEKLLREEDIQHSCTEFVATTQSSEDTANEKNDLAKRASFRLSSHNVFSLPSRNLSPLKIASTYKTMPAFEDKFTSSKKSHSTPAMYNLTDVNLEVIDKLLKQIKYFFNQKDEEKIKAILESYESDRNIHAFVESINVVLDTPAKRTLWFHILPILMDDDQEYCKRKILRIQELDLEKEKISSVSRASIFLSHFDGKHEHSKFQLDGRDVYVSVPEIEQELPEMMYQAYGLEQGSFARSDDCRRSKPMIRKRKGRKMNKYKDGLLAANYHHSMPLFTYTTKSAFEINTLKHAESSLDS